MKLKLVTCWLLAIVLMCTGLALAANVGNNNTVTHEHMTYVSIHQTRAFALNPLTASPMQNATGAGTVQDLGYYVENHSATAALLNGGTTDTATWCLQGSLDNSTFYNVQCLSIVNTVVSAFYNALATGAVPVPRYIRGNVTALSVANANTTGVVATAVSQPYGP